MSTEQAIILVAAGLLLLAGGFFLWRWWRRLPPGANSLSNGSRTWAKLRGERQVALVFLGGQGSSLGPKFAEAVRKAGGASFVGLIYLVEMAKSERVRAAEAIPVEFHDRLVVCQSDLYPVGLEGKSYDEVEAESGRWEPDVIEWAEEACKLASRNRSRPAVLLVIASTGGHAALCLPIVSVFHKYFAPTTYVISALSHEPAARPEFATMLARLRESNQVRGVLVADNWLQASRNDFGLTLFAAAFVTGDWLSDVPQPGYNALPKIFAREPGVEPVFVATFSTWYRTLPVYHVGGLPPVVEPIYYTFADKVVEAALDGFEQVQLAQYKASRLPTPAPRTRRYFYFVAPIWPQHLRRTGDRVEPGLHLNPAEKSFNLVSVSTALTPSTQHTIVGTLLLEAVVDGFSNTVAYAKGLPLPTPAPALSGSTNGMQTRRRARSRRPTP